MSKGRIIWAGNANSPGFNRERHIRVLIRRLQDRLSRATAPMNKLRIQARIHRAEATLLALILGRP